jgi:hypothetical protein
MGSPRWYELNELVHLKLDANDPITTGTAGTP